LGPAGRRYYSGFFQLHPILKDFDYYWRMEPDVHYYCDLDYDPFLYMKV
jgi:alpha 1,2-mannosyltransferase